MKHYIRSFVLLLVGKAFVNETKENGDDIGAKFSALIQVSVLLCLHAIAMLFVIAELAWSDVFIVMSSVSSKKSILVILCAIFMLGIAAAMNHLLPNTSRIRSEYDALIRNCVQSGSMLPRVASLYPYIALGTFVVSIALMIG
jgi:hypothetical protein